MTSPSDQRPRGALVVEDPHRRAVGPDAARLVVVGVQREVVEDPHRRAVGPDAARLVVVGVQREVGVGEALATREVVGEELLLAAIGDPDDCAVGPDATRREVACVQVELAVLDPLSCLEVVGVDGVVGAGAVLEEPERGAVGPGAGRVVVAAVEFLDVACDVPLELDIAGDRAGRAPRRRRRR